MSKMENTFAWGRTNTYSYKFNLPLHEDNGSISIIDNYYVKLGDFNLFKQEYNVKQNQQDVLINQKVNTNDFNNKVSELSTQQQINTNAINAMKWVPLTNIIRSNNRTTINLEGKRFIHLQGRFTNFTTNTGSWSNFTPFMIDTHNYNYMVRFPIFDWNTQRINGSIEVILENGNLILIGYNTDNQQTDYYLWGDVIGSN